MGITGDCGIIVVVVMVMVMDFVRVAVVIRSNLFNIVFGSGICGVGSGSGLSSGCGGFSLAQHHHRCHYPYHYQYHHHNHLKNHHHLHHHSHHTYYT